MQMYTRSHLNRHGFTACQELMFSTRVCIAMGMCQQRHYQLFRSAVSCVQLQDCPIRCAVLQPRDAHLPQHLAPNRLVITGLHNSTQAPSA
jgi:hypothetical protein